MLGIAFLFLDCLLIDPIVLLWYAAQILVYGLLLEHALNVFYHPYFVAHSKSNYHK